MTCSTPTAKNPSASPAEEPTLLNEQLESSPATVASIVDAAYSELLGGDYVPVSDCVDVLLDCLNAAEEPAVKTAVTALLPDFATGNLRKSGEFEAALKEIRSHL